MLVDEPIHLLLGAFLLGGYAIKNFALKYMTIVRSMAISMQSYFIWKYERVTCYRLLKPKREEVDVERGNLQFDMKIVEVINLFINIYEFRVKKPTLDNWKIDYKWALSTTP